MSVRRLLYRWVLVFVVRAVVVVRTVVPVGKIPAVASVVVVSAALLHLGGEGGELLFGQHAVEMYLILVEGLIDGYLEFGFALVEWEDKARVVAVLVVDGVDAVADMVLKGAQRVDIIVAVGHDLSQLLFLFLGEVFDDILDRMSVVAMDLFGDLWVCSCFLGA